MAIKYNASVEMKILGGLPVTVRFLVRPADTEVEEPGDYIEDYEIVSRSGKPLGEWVQRRVKETEGEERRIMQACFDSLR